MQGDRGSEQSRAQERQQEIAFAGGLPRVQLRLHGADVGLQCRRIGLLRQPRQHRGFVCGAHPHRIAAAQALEFALRALQRVLLPGHGGGIQHLLRLVAGGRRLDGLDQAADHLDAGRQQPLDLVGEFRRAAMAEGGARIAGEHREIARLHRRRGHGEMRGRRVRDVVPAVCRRLAVLADVGAVEGEVAGVARPHEVVDLVAVVADRARRRVHQPDVLQFELLDQVVVAAVVHAGHAAAVAGVLFAGRDGRLLRDLDRFEIRATGLAPGIGQDAVGHPVEPDRHPDPRGRASGRFIGHARGDEPVLDQVAFRGGVQLDRAKRAVVVGHHQPLRGDETGGAAAQRDHRAHRVSGEVGQVGRIALEAGRLQFLRQLRQLGRHPHAFIGVGCAAGQGQRKGRDGGAQAHSVVLGVGQSCITSPCTYP